MRQIIFIKAEIAKLRNPGKTNVNGDLRHINTYLIPKPKSKVILNLMPNLKEHSRLELAGAIIRSNCPVMHMNYLTHPLMYPRYRFYNIAGSNKCVHDLHDWPM